MVLIVEVLQAKALKEAIHELTDGQVEEAADRLRHDGHNISAADLWSVLDQFTLTLRPYADAIRVVPEKEFTEIPVEVKKARTM